MMKSISVTTILSVYNQFGAVRPEILEAAAARGRGVHAACTSYALGLFVRPLPEDWWGYLKSFRYWFDEYVKEVIFAEKRFYDPVFLFDGKPDLGVILKDDRRIVVDLKTPAAESPTWKGQLAAYRHLVGGNWDCMSLRLSESGKPAKAIVYNHAEDDFKAFLAALTAYRYFMR